MWETRWESSISLSLSETWLAPIRYDEHTVTSRPAPWGASSLWSPFYPVKLMDRGRVQTLAPWMRHFPQPQPRRTLPLRPEASWDYWSNITFRQPPLLNHFSPDCLVVVQQMIITWSVHDSVCLPYSVSSLYRRLSFGLLCMYLYMCVVFVEGNSQCTMCYAICSVNIYSAVNILFYLIYHSMTLSSNELILVILGLFRHRSFPAPRSPFPALPFHQHIWQ